jgi:hypothetical protein
LAIHGAILLQTGRNRKPGTKIVGDALGAGASFLGQILIARS